MKILALDLGKKTGFCVLRKTTVTSSGMVSFEEDDFSKRMALLGKWLRLTCERELPDVVIYETPHHRGGAATRSLLGMVGVVHAVGYDYSVVLKCHIATLGSYIGWGGKKGTKKEAAEEFCRSVGVEPEDDNHADAVCLACYAADTVEVPDGKSA